MHVCWPGLPGAEQPGEYMSMMHWAACSVKSSGVSNCCDTCGPHALPALPCSSLPLPWPCSLGSSGH